MHHGKYAKYAEEKPVLTNNSNSHCKIHLYGYLSVSAPLVVFKMSIIMNVFKMTAK